MNFDAAIATYKKEQHIRNSFSTRGSIIKVRLYDSMCILTESWTITGESTLIYIKLQYVYIKYALGNCLRRDDMEMMFIASSVWFKSSRMIIYLI